MEQPPFIEFYDDNHSYWNGYIKYKSVGYWLSKFTKEYEPEYWLTYKTLQKMVPEEFDAARKEYGYKAIAEVLFPPLFKILDMEEFKQERALLDRTWEKDGLIARSKGAIFHSVMENNVLGQMEYSNPFDEEKYVVIQSDKQFDNQSLADNLWNLPNGIYNELLIFNEEIQTAGQSDLVYLGEDGEGRFCDLLDYKTNNVNPKKDRKRYDKFLLPLQHLYDDKHNRYSIQLSFYGWMLEQFGYRVRNLAYQWHGDYDPEKFAIVQVPYLKDEIEAMITHEI